jgi:O-antigen ligase
MNLLTARFPSLARRVLPTIVVLSVLAVAALVGRPPLAGYSRLLLMLGIGFGGLLFLLQEPGLGLVALAALSFTLPLTFGTGTEVRLTAPVLLIAGVAAAWLLTGLHGQSLRLPVSRTVLPLLLFVASGLVSLLAGRAYWDPLVPQPRNLLLVQLGQWGMWALSALAFLLGAELGRRTEWLRRATWAFLAAAGFMVLVSLLPVVGPPLGAWFNFGGAGDMAWVWLGGLATGQLVFNQRLTRARRLLLLTMLLAAGYILWLPSRVWVSGWAPFTLAVVAVLGVWLWRRNRALAVFAAVGLAFVVLALYPALRQHAGGESEFEASWGGRAVLYRAVLKVVEDHPILGLGPAAYRQYAAAHWLATGPGHALYIRPQVSSHNNYIDIYAQQGLVGLALFLWFLAEVALLGRRLTRRFDGDFQDGYVQGALGGLVATVLAMMLADWFLPFIYQIGFAGFRTSAVAWMFLGGLVALEDKSSEQQAVAEEMARPLAESGER